MYTREFKGVYSFYTMQQFLRADMDGLKLWNIMGFCEGKMGVMALMASQKRQPDVSRSLT